MSCSYNCGSGQYRGDSSHTYTSCRSCPAGQYQGSSGQSSCRSCSSGQYQGDTASSSCRDCQTGKYQNSGGQSSCRSCSAGKYNPSTGSTGSSACRSCGAGQASSSSASSSCSNCAAGRFQNNAGQASCIACAAGSANPSTASSSTSACASCAAGKYQADTGQTSCISCAMGTSNANVGSTSAGACAECAAGQHQPNSAQSSCIDCAAGRFASGVGAAATTNAYDEAVAFTGGTTTCDQYIASGVLSCTGNLLPGQQYGAGGSWIAEQGYAWTTGLCDVSCGFGAGGTTACEDCPVGQTSAAGSSACAPIACDPGQFLSGSSCMNCAAGQYAAAAGSAACSPCGAGKFQAVAAQSSCDGCPPGRHQPTTGQSSCIACSSGQYGTGTSGQCDAPSVSATSFEASTWETDGVVSPDASSLSWTRQSGETPSSGTGPTGAHEGSYYLFTEASQTYDQHFILGLPTVHSPGAEVTIRFWYHMYGSAMGSLFVQRSDAGADAWSDVWSVSDPQQTAHADDWLQAEITFTASVDTDVRIDGLTGDEFKSDIAIDALSFDVQSPCVIASCSACTTCAAGQHQTAGCQSTTDRACSDCTSGTYQPATNAASCINCVVGKFRASTGGSSEADCSACQGGRYQPTPAQSQCITCDAGQFVAESGSDSELDCTACNAGQHSSAGASACTTVTCGRGEFVDGNACAACPAGQFQDQLDYTGSACSACAQCGAGNYQAAACTDTIDTTCQSCGAETYQSQATFVGSSCPQCSICAAGQYQVTDCTVSSNRACTDCAAGQYQAAASQTSCIDCQAGQFRETPGGASSDSCLPCGDGHFAAAASNSEDFGGANAGSSFCLPCPAGRSRLAATGDSCVAGDEASDAGTNCADSSVGWTGFISGNEYTCTHDASNDYADTGCKYNGATSALGCTSCVAGQFQGASGQSTCTTCGAGHFTADQGAGFVAVGATLCQTCSAGTYSTVSSAACQACAAGTYSEAGAQECRTCSAGQYQPDTGEDDCRLCSMRCHGQGDCTSVGECSCLQDFSGDRCEHFDACGKYVWECLEAHPAALCTNSTCPGGRTCDAPVSVEDRDCVTSALATPAWTPAEQPDTPAEQRPSLRTVCEMGLPNLIASTEGWLALAQDYLLQTATENARIVSQQLCLESRFDSLQCLTFRSAVGTQTARRTVAEIQHQQRQLSDLHEEACALAQSISSRLGESLSASDVRPLTYEMYQGQLQSVNAYINALIQRQDAVLADTSTQQLIAAEKRDLADSARDEASLWNDKASAKAQRIGVYRSQIQGLTLQITEKLDTMGVSGETLVNSTAALLKNATTRFRQAAGIATLRQAERATLEQKLQAFADQQTAMQAGIDAVREQNADQETLLLEQLTTLRFEAEQRASAFDANLAALADDADARHAALQNELAHLVATVQGGQAVLQDEMERSRAHLQQVEDSLQDDLARMDASAASREARIAEAVGVLETNLANLGGNILQGQQTLQTDLEALGNAAERREERMMSEFGNIKTEVREGELRTKQHIQLLRDEQRAGFEQMESEFVSVRLQNDRHHNETMGGIARLEAGQRRIQDKLDALATGSSSLCAAHEQLSQPVEDGCGNSINMLWHEKAQSVVDSAGIFGDGANAGVKWTTGYSVDGTDDLAQCCDDHDTCYGSCGRRQAFCDEELNACMRHHASLPTEIPYQLIDMVPGLQGVGTAADQIATAIEMETLFDVDEIIQEFLGCGCYLEAQRTHVAVAAHIEDGCAENRIEMLLRKADEVCDSISGFMTSALVRGEGMIGWVAHIINEDFSKKLGNAISGMTARLKEIIAAVRTALQGALRDSCHEIFSGRRMQDSDTDAVCGDLEPAACTLLIQHIQDTDARLQASNSFVDSTAALLLLNTQVLNAGEIDAASVPAIDMHFLELDLLKEDVLVSGVRSAMSKSSQFADYETDARQVVTLLRSKMEQTRELYATVLAKRDDELQRDMLLRRVARALNRTDAALTVADQKTELSAALDYKIRTFSLLALGNLRDQAAAYEYLFLAEAGLDLSSLQAQRMDGNEVADFVQQTQLQLDEQFVTTAGSFTNCGGECASYTEFQLSEFPSEHARLLDSGQFTVTIPLPDSAGYWGVTWTNARVFLIGLANEEVGVEARQVGTSVFLDQNGHVRRYTHQPPASSSHGFQNGWTNPPLSFAYDGSPDGECRAFSTMSSGSNCGANMLDTYVQYSPYSTWSLEVDASYDLSSVYAVRFEFDVAYRGGVGDLFEDSSGSRGCRGASLDAAQFGRDSCIPPAVCTADLCGAGMHVLSGVVTCDGLCTEEDCCVENSGCTMPTPVPYGYSVPFPDGQTASALGILACHEPYAGGPVAICPSAGGPFEMTGCQPLTCGNNEDPLLDFECGTGYIAASGSVSLGINTTDYASTVAICCDRVFCEPSDCGSGFHLRPEAEASLPPPGTAVSQTSCCSEDVSGMCSGNTDGNDFSCPLLGYARKEHSDFIENDFSGSAEEQVAACCDRLYCTGTECGDGYCPKADAEHLPPAGVAASQAECCDSDTASSTRCATGTYKVCGSAAADAGCEPCSPVANSAFYSSLNCTTSTNSRVDDCEPGFYKEPGGIASADRCTPCRPVAHRGINATYTCTSWSDTRVSACQFGYTIVTGGAGEADTCTVRGMCAGNEDPATEPDVHCSQPSELRPSAHQIVGRTASICCHVTGMCIGNDDNATDTQCGIGFTRKPYSSMISVVGADTSARAACCDRIFCRPSDCGGGFQLKPDAESTLPPAGTITSQAVCCSMVIEGMCSGNTDGNDFVCPLVGYMVKPNASFIPAAGNDTLEARTATCCDRLFCTGAECGDGYRPKPDAAALPPPGVAVSQGQCCVAATTTVSCAMDTYKVFGATSTDDRCEPCTPVSNAASSASVECTSAEDTRVGACNAGFYKAAGGYRASDACVACTQVEHASGTASYTCTSGSDTRVSACEFGYTRVAGGAGEADACIVQGMCAGNADPAVEPDVLCSQPSELRPSAHRIMGRTATICCHVTGMCIGNTDRTEDIRCATGEVAVFGASRLRIAAGCCEAVDACANVSCSIPSPSSCQTGGACRSGHCQPTQWLAEGSPCNDGVDDTSNDVCSRGSCAGKAVLASSLTLPVDTAEAIAPPGTAERARLESGIKQVLLSPLRRAGMFVVPDDISIHAIAAGSVVVDFSVRVPVDQATPSAKQAVSTQIAASTASLTIGGTTVQVADAEVQPFNTYSWKRHHGSCGSCQNSFARVVPDRYECVETDEVGNRFGYFSGIDEARCESTVGPIPSSSTECCTALSLLAPDPDEPGPEPEPEGTLQAPAPQPEPDPTQPFGLAIDSAQLELLILVALGGAVACIGVFCVVCYCRRRQPKAPPRAESGDVGATDLERTGTAEELFAFLRQLGIRDGPAHEYATVLVERGYDTVQAFELLDSETLQAEADFKPGHLQLIEQHRQGVALLSAVGKGDAATAEHLLLQTAVDCNFTLDRFDGSDETPLCVAARIGNVQIMELLLAHPDIAVDKTHQHGRSALFSAAENGNAACVQMLVQHGADATLSVTDSNGESWTAQTIAESLSTKLNAVRPSAGDRFAQVVAVLETGETAEAEMSPTAQKVRSAAMAKLAGAQWRSRAMKARAAGSGPLQPSPPEPVKEQLDDGTTVVMAEIASSEAASPAQRRRPVRPRIMAAYGNADEAISVPPQDLSLVPDSGAAAPPASAVAAAAGMERPERNPAFNPDAARYGDNHRARQLAAELGALRAQQQQLDAEAEDLVALAARQQRERVAALDDASEPRSPEPAPAPLEPAPAPAGASGAAAQLWDRARSAGMGLAAFAAGATQSATLEEHLLSMGIPPAACSDYAAKLIEDGFENAAMFDALSIDELRDDYRFKKGHLMAVKRSRSGYVSSPGSAASPTSQSPSQP
eukprot:COSAG04_NODE_2_length_56781_cov_25.092252_31_plen_3914_part_00